MTLRLASRGRYAHKAPEVAVKRPVVRDQKQRLHDACDDQYLLESDGFEADEAWTRAALGNGLHQEEM